MPVPPGLDPSVTAAFDTAYNNIKACLGNQGLGPLHRGGGTRRLVCDSLSLWHLTPTYLSVSFGGPSCQPSSSGQPLPFLNHTALHMFSIIQHLYI